MIKNFNACLCPLIVNDLCLIGSGAYIKPGMLPSRSSFVQFILPSGSSSSLVPVVTAVSELHYLIRSKSTVIVFRTVRFRLRRRNNFKFFPSKNRSTRSLENAFELNTIIM